MQSARLSVSPQLLVTPRSSRITLQAFLRLPVELRPLALRSFNTISYHQQQPPASTGHNSLSYGSNGSNGPPVGQVVLYGGLHKQDSEGEVVQDEEVRNGKQKSLRVGGVARRYTETRPLRMRNATPPKKDSPTQSTIRRTTAVGTRKGKQPKTTFEVETTGSVPASTPATHSDNTEQSLRGSGEKHVWEEPPSTRELNIRHHVARGKQSSPKDLARITFLKSRVTTLRTSERKTRSPDLAGSSALPTSRNPTEVVGQITEQDRAEVFNSLGDKGLESPAHEAVGGRVMEKMIGEISDQDDPPVSFSWSPSLEPQSRDRDTQQNNNDMETTSESAHSFELMHADLHAMVEDNESSLPIELVPLYSMVDDHIPVTNPDQDEPQYPSGADESRVRHRISHPTDPSTEKPLRISYLDHTNWPELRIVRSGNPPPLVNSETSQVGSSDSYVGMDGKPSLADTLTVGKQSSKRLGSRSPKEPEIATKKVTQDENISQILSRIKESSRTQGDASEPDIANIYGTLSTSTAAPLPSEVQSSSPGELHPGVSSTTSLRAEEIELLTNTQALQRELRMCDNSFISYDTQIDHLAERRRQCERAAQLLTEKDPDAVHGADYKLLRWDINHCAREIPRLRALRILSQDRRQRVNLILMKTGARQSDSNAEKDASISVTQRATETVESVIPNDSSRPELTTAAGLDQAAPDTLTSPLDIDEAASDSPMQQIQKTTTPRSTSGQAASYTHSNPVNADETAPDSSAQEIKKSAIISRNPLSSRAAGISSSSLAAPDTESLSLIRYGARPMDAEESPKTTYVTRTLRLPPAVSFDSSKTKSTEVKSSKSTTEFLSTTGVISKPTGLPLIRSYNSPQPKSVKIKKSLPAVKPPPKAIKSDNSGTLQEIIAQISGLKSLISDIATPKKKRGPEPSIFEAKKRVAKKQDKVLKALLDKASTNATKISTENGATKDEKGSTGGLTALTETQTDGPKVRFPLTEKPARPPLVRFVVDPTKTATSEASNERTARGSDQLGTPLSMSHNQITGDRAEMHPQQSENDSGETENKGDLPSQQLENGFTQTKINGILFKTDFAHTENKGELRPQQSESDLAQTENMGLQHDPPRVELSPTALLQELFPEEAKRWHPRREDPQDTDITVPRLPLPVDGELISLRNNDRVQLEDVNHRVLQKKDYLTVLELNSGNTTLTADDFRRLTPKGQHLREWTVRGDFKTVFPRRNPWTLERTHPGHYYIVFDSGIAAHAYLEHLFRVQTLARQYTPSSLSSPIPPPPGYLINGQDVHALIRDFTIIAPFQSLTVNTYTVGPGFNPFRANLFQRGGYAEIVGEGYAGVPQVLLTMFNGPQPTYYELTDAIGKSGRDRNQAWQLIERPERIRMLEMNRYGRDKEAGGLDADDDYSERIAKLRKPEYGQRWIVSFRDGEDAKSFVRAWHGRPLPWASKARERDKQDIRRFGERITMVEAELLCVSCNVVLMLTIQVSFVMNISHVSINGAKVGDSSSSYPRVSAMHPVSREVGTGRLCVPLHKGFRLVGMREGY
ncbi:hypothetical protein EJ08DRAFT_658778 [Tothia fuscella]|uniref:Uncharacterized protein n=1 Tax=Tothia fuscella TaxID=1048955 RepID=A0A9P4NWV7_9PEZI|nr:hypothetical protein EJ08DRAFT_658778 [Tothia fuscella]